MSTTRSTRSNTSSSAARDSFLRQFHHALKYLYSTANYGISYHSNCSATLRAFNHFPNHHDKEAYSDATPLSPAECHELTAFSDACWGGQFGNAVLDGTPMEILKFCSLSGFVICRCGGPIVWRAICQNQTALSSCEAEIYATNSYAVELMGVKHRASDLGMLDASKIICIFNDNEGCVNWSAAVTGKCIKHLNLRETKVREIQADGEAVVLHIPGIINPSNLFTKEIKDAAHHRRLRDTMMVSLANFMTHGHVMSVAFAGPKSLPYYNVISAAASPTSPVETRL